MRIAGWVLALIVGTALGFGIGIPIGGYLLFFWILGSGAH